MSNTIAGFSKLGKEQKIEWLTSHYFADPNAAATILKQYWNDDAALQKLHDEFIENTVSNFYLPLGVAPGFVINGKEYVLPMAVEESSVVAAAARSAKFWAKRGGFKATVISTEKIGQVHFLYKGDAAKLQAFFDAIKSAFFTSTEDLTKNMQKRGGGILDIELRDKTTLLPNYYQLHATFETVDSMGANFINSCLEQFANTLKAQALGYDAFTECEQHIEVIMSILSNYVPNCVVRAEVSCPVSDLNDDKNIKPEDFAQKFVTAVQVAQVEPFRAVTHNKGIMNGIDAVVVATGNDFRAVEAGVHAYAAKDGQYRSLSHAKIEDGIFTFWLDVPLALGTVGGLTTLHPLVKLCLEMLGNPSAKELMQFVAVAGLAQNFAAVRSLTTTGIQQGHMKMHLMNILNQLGANDLEKHAAVKHFETATVSHSGVADFIEELRKNDPTKIEEDFLR
ncbi:hydroxymethylglutaryl-CoA reductase [Flavobacterium akiainvivens]|uniref:3-hydroxy-3-methylglutaryl coenzyme A reductase n=1 Tax=Flavobacterium akiainvivens TaxID=1202724 RepID=A0A0M9VJF3_9FLAO|nr:hydroxymethylglutaryl-CoA reductase, degradative [Flavobacterium akiainvivens]KOS07716.1 hydroxymethylglutaryl-CoA reductase [Flavobacterium akiainvivens]SFQ24922.1 3-hydroxy-3-methylglutaryl-coenzyme A reductase [Flavobacterium akiainvivens]